MDYMEDKMKAVNYNPRLRLHLFIVLVVSALISIFFGGYFTRFFIAEIAILSIFAMSLDFLAARGGLVSLGHAMFLGVLVTTFCKCMLPQRNVRLLGTLCFDIWGKLSTL